VAIALPLPGAVPLLACNLLDMADAADCSVRCSICCKAETLGLAPVVSGVCCVATGERAEKEQESAGTFFGWIEIAPSDVDKDGCVESTGLLRDPKDPARRDTPLASAAESADNLPSSALTLSGPRDEPSGVPAEVPSGVPTEELLIEPFRVGGHFLAEFLPAIGQSAIFLFQSFPNLV